MKMTLSSACSSDGRPARPRREAGSVGLREDVVLVQDARGVGLQGEDHRLHSRVREEVRVVVDHLAHHLRERHAGPEQRGVQLHG